MKLFIVNWFVVKEQFKWETCVQVCVKLTQSEKCKNFLISLFLASLLSFFLLFCFSALNIWKWAFGVVKNVNGVVKRQGKWIFYDLEWERDLIEWKLQGLFTIFWVLWIIYWFRSKLNATITRKTIWNKERN